MSISTIQVQNTRSSNKPNLVVYAAIVIGVLLLVFASSKVIKNIVKSNANAALSVTLTYGSGEVYLNDNLLGNTPFDSTSLKTGENKLTIKNGTRQYDTTVNFLSSAQVVVDRDLGISDIFSSGKNYWLDKNDSGPTLSVISEPSGAAVYIDNTDYGRTPLSNSNLTDGDYEIRIDMPGYEPQIGRIKIEKGYTLNISANLFPMPVSDRVVNLEGSTDLYNVTSDNPLLTSDTKTWVKAIVYWNQTRGINLDSVGVNKDLVFDYFLDYKGDLYDKNGDIISDTASYATLKDATKGAYLGKRADGFVLSDLAKQTYMALKGTAAGGAAVGKMATIKETGLGWLRVRDSGSLTGTELAKVNTGEKYSVLEDTTDWVKIKVSDTISGWVSKAYVTIN